MATDIESANKKYERTAMRKKLRRNGEKPEVRIDWFFKCNLWPSPATQCEALQRQVFRKHFSKRHHLSAVFAILVAFICLIIVGIFSDYRIFQVPAAASITVLFAILIAAAGAFSLFLGSWSIPVIIIIYFIINSLYQKNIIDLRNRAYGLNYSNTEQRPNYDEKKYYAHACRHGH